MKIRVTIKSLPKHAKAALIAAGETDGDVLVIDPDVFERTLANAPPSPSRCPSCGS